MKIKSVRLIKTNIPFVLVFKHSSKSRSEVEALLVEIETEKGFKGYGETLPREYVTGESIESVEKNLKEYVLPQIKGQEFKTFDSLVDFLDNFYIFFKSLKSYEMCVKTPIELSLLDAFSKEKNISLLELFGSPKINNVIYSGVVSADKPFIVKQFLKKYNKIGLKQFKLKVGKDFNTDLKNILLTKKIIGEDAEIRVDANEGWNLEQAKEELTKFHELGIVSVEQPMPKSDKEDYPKLMNFLKGKMDISLDEGLCTYDDAKWMVENEGASIFNLRISKNGGITNALKIHKLASENNIRCQLGAQVGETSLLSSAGRILSAICGDFPFHEGSFGTNLLAYDLTNSPLEFGNNGDGEIEYLNKKMGLGIEVNNKLLNKMTKEITEF